MENNNTTSKLIRGDENAENQNGTSSPSDGASCSESSYVEIAKDAYDNKIMIGVYDPKTEKYETGIYDLVKDQGKLEGLQVQMFHTIPTSMIIEHRELFDRLVDTCRKSR
jgi:hypothetical protein